MSGHELDGLLASAPERINGFPAFAPELAAGGEDYPSEVFAALAAVEEKSFWFRARNRILLSQFARFVGSGEARVLEVGCGTGYVLKGLAERFAGYELVGAEAFVSGLGFARSRVPLARFCQLDATRMPFDGEFDAVGFFDVLEHLDDDVGALAGARRALRAGGWLLVTVPQHQWMWSQLDEASGHKRRYSRRILLDRVRSAGFGIAFVSSFVTTLLPVMAARRQWSGTVREGSSLTEGAIKDLSPGGVLNSLAGGAMRADEWLIRMGVSLPIGGSLLLVGRRVD